MRDVVFCIVERNVVSPPLQFLGDIPSNQTVGRKTSQPYSFGVIVHRNIKH